MPACRDDLHDKQLLIYYSEQPCHSSVPADPQRTGLLGEEREVGEITMSSHPSLVLLPPPLVDSVDSRRVLASSARRRGEDLVTVYTEAECVTYG